LYLSVPPRVRLEGVCTDARRLRPAAILALAMAYLEAATVVYLREIYGITDLVRDVPAYDPRLAAVELGRELATLVLLLALGWAAGSTRQARLGLACFAFGLWDILYYFWLRLLIGWPASLLDTDILFLIPLPWWGPVLAPMLIACLAAAGGWLAVSASDRGRMVRPRKNEWGGMAAGILLVLYAFMADALAMLPARAEDLGRLRPSAFPWPVYLAGLAAMAWAVLGSLRRAARAAAPA